MKRNKHLHLRGSHSVHNLNVHLVFVTKYRRKVLDAAALRLLQDVFDCACQQSNATLQEFNGESDHVHLLVCYPPTITVAALVGRLKSASAQTLRALRQDIAAKYYKPVLWTGAYFAASCGGVTLEMLHNYIERQQTPR